MSIGFGAVAEGRPSSKLFTIAHVLLGASAIGGAIALFAQSVIAGSAAIASAEYVMASVRASFAAADADSSGSLSRAELAAVLGRCCDELTEAERDAAISVFDHDGDGNVTIDEFLSAVGRFVDGETPIDDAIRRWARPPHARTPQPPSRAPPARRS